MILTQLMLELFDRRVTELITVQRNEFDRNRILDVRQFEGNRIAADCS